MSDETPQPRPRSGRSGRHEAAADQPSAPADQPSAPAEQQSGPTGEHPTPAGPDPFDGPEWHAENPFSRSSRPVSSAGGQSGAGSSSTGPRVKVSRRKQRVLRRRRRVGFIMVGFGGLIVLVGLYLVITALLARSQLNTVRADVGKLRSQIGSGDLSGARATAADVASHAHSAGLFTSGPVWALAADLPGGEPFQTIRGVTSAVDELGQDALPRLVEVSEKVDPSKLRRGDGSINLAPLVAARPELRRADIAAKAATATVRGLTQHTWISAIDDARTQVLDQLTALGRTVSSANYAAQIAPQMLGQTGKRSYMVSFQTEAELRGTGGLPGAFAIVVADHGKLRFTRFESDSTLRGVPSGLRFGDDFDHLYAGANATEEYSDSNVSPNFPYAAQIWTAMWKKYSGQQLDGAIALDPTALSYLLRVAGPVQLPDRTRISAGNVVALTQQRVYSKFPRRSQQDGRKKFQLQVAKAISQRVLTARANATALVRAAGRAAGEHRLLAWSADPDTEKLLSRTVIGGGVPQTAGPYAGLSINNAAGNKLDYYLQASMSWKRISCGSSADVEVTLTLRNNAPAKLPDYVYGLTGRRGYPVKPGDNRLLVGYFATKGAQLTKVTLNGKSSTSQVGAELGHPVFTADILLPRGQTQTIVLHLNEPTSDSAPIVRAQPLVNPLKVSVDDADCG